LQRQLENTTAVLICIWFVVSRSLVGVRWLVLATQRRWQQH